MAKKQQTTLLKDLWITAGIFSSHYLLERLPQAGPKIWPSDEEVLSAYKAFQELYKKNIVGLRKGNEANTERRFIDKIFNKLGFGYLNQDKIPEAERRQVPDYFLYYTPEEADKAFELSPHKKYKLSISIAEAKRWDHNLDQPSSGKGKATKGRYPHQQIRDYLNESEHIRWGILTNGKEWRLYFKEGRSSKFFEIDIEACLEDLQKFKYFYILFRPDAFIKDSLDRCLLDNIYDESLRFQEDIERNLREKVFKCVEWLGHGFLSREENRLSKKDLDSIYHHSLILLYRILFVLNAEARDLLSTNPQTKYYKHYGIQRIKDKVTNEKGEFISNKTVLYDALLALFHLINGSDEKLNKDMSIPRYNGGLFDPERYKFLEENKAGDDILSEVIYELSYRTDKTGETHSIDYKGLGERHLGTVYEGLLEHKFSLTNGKIVLQNDKGERKATGAYYTPDYIVKYIVENTLTPILKEIDEKVKEEYKGIKDDSFAKEVLKLNICDPAMGSGHFLVESVQYLADEIAYHPTTELKTPKGETEYEINYWKRKVVESCIYGVDIKELAVELAKLSLWLKTVDKSQPLNFLDHHLRRGNSLIGAKINDLSYLPISKGKQKKSEKQDEQLVLFDKSRFKEDITAVIKGFHAIEEMPSEKLSDIKKKEKTFNTLKEELIRYREIADLWTSLFFGNNLEEKEQVFEDLLKDQFKYQTDMFGSDAEVTVKKKSKAGISSQIYSFVVSSLQSPDGKTRMPKLASLLENSESISKDKNFFHWELEFPEVFFNADGGTKENLGFDCVIGNPPYVNVEGIPSDERDFLMQAGIYTTPIKRMDIFIPFHELSIKLLRYNGHHSFIVPFPLLTQDYGQQLRLFFLKNTIIKSIADLSRYKIFPDAVVRNIIPVFEKKITESDYAINVITQNEDPNKIQAVRGTVKSVDASQFRDTYENMFRIDLTPELHSIQKKIDSKTIKFGKIFAASWGARGVPVEKFHLDSPINKHCKKMVKGGNIERYGLAYSEKWLLYDVKKLYRPSMPDFFENDKVIFQKVTGEHGLIGVFDNQKYYTDDSLICCIPKYRFEGYDENKLHKHKIYTTKDEIDSSKNYNILYVLAVMNSQANGFYFSKFVGYALNVYPENIEYLPIPRIAFNTPEKERKEFFKEAVTLYKRSKYEDVLKWAEYELALKRTDTSHDFLAYLAEQMIELNKIKNEEIKGFLEWLEREIGSGIDELTNKTAIKEYHEHDFNYFLEVLKKNKNKISLDPSDRKKQELLEKHFSKSMTVLQPLKEKIKATDKLIDQIVYKLYGLNDEEIVVVEGRK